MTPSSTASAKMRTLIRLSLSAAAIAALLAGYGIFDRLQAQSELKREAEQESVMPVDVTLPKSGTSGEDLILPATLQAFTETPIYARTSGYLKRWYADIGAHVKAGDLLAEIDTPELDQQTRQAEADLKTAIANNELAQIAARRWRDLASTNAVSKQDVDNHVADAEAKEAAVASYRANLDRLRELKRFERVVSPVEGVVTARNTDIGDLIDAGTGNGVAKELFHVAAMKRLRVYVPVPESYAEDMLVGSTATLHVREHPGETFSARLVNTASAITAGSHTLLVQLEVDNSVGTLLPGGYVDVHFKVMPRTGALRILANTLIFGVKGMQVATVNDQNKVVLQDVVLGRDFGNEVEVLQGVQPNQRVIVNPSDSLSNGQTVRGIPEAGKAGDK